MDILFHFFQHYFYWKVSSGISYTILPPHEYDGGISGGISNQVDETIMQSRFSKLKNRYIAEIIIN